VAGAERIRAGKHRRREVRLSLAQAAEVREEPVAAVLVRMVEPGANTPQAGAVLVVRHRQTATIIRLDAAMAAAVQRAKILPQVATAGFPAAEAAEAAEIPTQAQAVPMVVQVELAKSVCGPSEI